MMLANLGIGRVEHLNAEHTMLRKYSRRCLTERTVEWLRQNRVPASIFGYEQSSQAHPSHSKDTSLRGTNPCDTVKATQEPTTTTAASPAPVTAADGIATPLLGPTSTRPLPSPFPGPVIAPAQPSPVAAIVGAAPHEDEVETIWNAVVPGILLTRKDARAKMREVLKSANISAVVKDAKITHTRYYLFDAQCLQCEGADRPVTYRGTYYCVSLGVPAKTFVKTSKGNHSHAPDAASDSARLLLPLPERAAQEYLLTPPPLTTKGLLNYLDSKGFAKATLPPKEKLQRRLQNHKTKEISKSSGPPRQVIVERSLEHWPEQMPAGVAELYLLNTPPRVCEASRVCIPFSCRGMVAAMMRQQCTKGVLLVDVKQSCLAHGWGIITACLMTKDKLRKTSLGYRDGKKIQGTAFTSHGEPTLQAILNTESTENVVQFLETLKHLWAEMMPQHPLWKTGWCKCTRTTTLLWKRHGDSACPGHDP